MTIPPIFRGLEGRLIVSCQADKGDAFYAFMDRFARAAVWGGAAAIRANGLADVRAIRAAVSVPIIGIHKAMAADGKILITGSFEDAAALVAAGADAIALDCTRRGQQMGALDRLRRIKTELNVPVLADIATVEEAVAAADAGADFVLPTMRGYTDETSHIQDFNPSFIHRVTEAVSVPVMAEGRVDTPSLAAEALRAGAFAVVVGTVLTRPHIMVRRFADALENTACALQSACYAGAIDLGGTNTKFGIVSNRGDLLWHATRPTPAHAGRAALLSHLEAIIGLLLERSSDLSCPLERIGIATAGWVDPTSGRVVYATENLPGWTGTDIVAALAKTTSLPIFVENDANALAVGEHCFGAGRGLRNFVTVTLGTGVGGGSYIGGQLHRGAHFLANAFGHITLEPNGRPCTCGRNGCIEAYTNTAALLEYAGGRYASAELLIAAANTGEPTARDAIGTLARYLAQGCSTVLQLLDPEALIVAGGLAEDNPLLVAALTAELANGAPNASLRRLHVCSSNLGYHAGVLGAAAVAFEASA
jgi:predicted NBD/HSP70 family sugar kinase/putative N-acetylmannosamine-6-phosphate epimerase